MLKNDFPSGDAGHCTGPACDLIAQTPSAVPGIVLIFSCAQRRGNCNRSRDVRRVKGRRGRRRGGGVERGNKKKREEEGERGAGVRWAQREQIWS